MRAPVLGRVEGAPYQRLASDPVAKTARARQRAAVSAARKSKSNRGWWALSAVVVIVGVILIVMSREDPAAPIANQDHWHSAFGVNVCGEWLEAAPEFETAAENSAQRTGIHTHGDGLIHTHPFVTAEAGKNATIGQFLEYGGYEASSDSFTFTDGTEHKTGDKCGDKEAVVRWEVNGEPHDGNISGYHQHDGDIIALALLPEDEEIGEPPSAAQMADPLAAEEGRELVGAPTSLPEATDTTVAGETTVPGETVPGETAAPTETTTGETAGTTAAP